MAVASKKTVAKKSVAKRTVAKRTVAKRTVAKKAVTKKTVAKKPAIKDAFTKTQLYSFIAEESGITKKQVGAVLESLYGVIERHIKKRGIGEFTLPGLLKVKTIRKPAVKARKGVNPFTKEEMMFKAKPARTVVKINALKKLKDMVST